MKAFDRNKIDEATLALLYLNLHQPSQNRAWKGFERETLNRLYEKGWIDDPKNAAKSVYLTEEGFVNLSNYSGAYLVCRMNMQTRRNHRKEYSKFASLSTVFL